MKASAALLLVLAALALVSAPLTAEAKKKRPGGEVAAAEKKVADSFCAVNCELHKGAEFVLCKDECELQQRSNLVGYGRVQCRGKCTEQKGITKEGLEVCLAKCEKDYKVQAKLATDDCAKVCAREKTPKLQEKCRKKCTPPPS